MNTTNDTTPDFLAEAQSGWTPDMEISVEELASRLAALYEDPRQQNPDGSLGDMSRGEGRGYVTDRTNVALDRHPDGRWFADVLTNNPLPISELRALHSSIGAALAWLATQ